jgi:hypothetical protein
MILPGERKKTYVLNNASPARLENTTTVALDNRCTVCAMLNRLENG